MNEVKYVKVARTKIGNFDDLQKRMFRDTLTVEDEIRHSYAEMKDSITKGTFVVAPGETIPTGRRTKKNINTLRHTKMESLRDKAAVEFDELCSGQRETSDISHFDEILMRADVSYIEKYHNYCLPRRKQFKDVSVFVEWLQLERMHLEKCLLFVNTHTMFFLIFNGAGRLFGDKFVFNCILYGANSP